MRRRMLFGKDQKTRWHIDPGRCETEAKSGEVFNQYGGKGEGGRVSKYSIKISPCALAQTTSWKIFDFAFCVYWILHLIFCLLKRYKASAQITSWKCVCILCPIFSMCYVYFQHLLQSTNSVPCLQLWSYFDPWIYRIFVKLYLSLSKKKQCLQIFRYFSFVNSSRITGTRWCIKGQLFRIS